MKPYRVRHSVTGPGVGSATHARRSRVRSAAILPLLLVFNAACVRSLARSAGQGAVEGARDALQTDGTQEALESTANFAVAYVDEAFRTDLAPTLDTAVDRLGSRFERTLDSGEAMLLRAEDSLAVAIGGPLSDALAELVRRNIETAGSEFRQELGLLSEDLAANIEDRMTPALANAITTATKAFMSELTEAARTDLADALKDALTEAVGSAASAGTEKVTPLWESIRTVLLVLAGVGVLIVGAWLYRETKLSKRALAVVTREVHEAGDDQLKARIQARTADRNVERWFQSFLDKEGYPK